MKKLPFVQLLCGAILSLSAMGTSFAQSCATAVPLNQSGASNINTCTGGGAYLTKDCALFNNAANDYVFTFTPQAGFTATSITLTNNSANGTWTPQMLLQSGAGCGTISDCEAIVAAADANQNTTAVLTLSSATPPVSAGTTYYLVVSGANGTTGCGVFSLGVNGSLPVTLQNFKVD